MGTFEAYINEASKAIESKDLTYIVKAFYELGRYSEIMHNPSVDVQFKNSRILRNEIDRKLPLLHRSAAKKYLIKRAQSIADDLWKKDTFKQYLISAMCKQVRNILEREIQTYDEESKELLVLPKKNEAIRKWLKPIAPKWASKSGAPKK